MQSGLKNLDDDAAYYALPAISLGTNYGGIGSGSSVPFFNISNTFQYVDSLTLTRGRHSLKIGADIRRNQNMNRNGLSGNGLLNFGGSYTARNPLLVQVAGQTDTGNGFADMLLGYLSGGLVARFSAFDQSFSRMRNTDLMYFVQDDSRVNSRLTLNLGLRWELHTPFHDKFKGGNILDFNYPGGRLMYIDKAFTDLVNNPIQAACCARDTLTVVDWRDWAPRIGLAWRPLTFQQQLRGARRLRHLLRRVAQLLSHAIGHPEHPVSFPSFAHAHHVGEPASRGHPQPVSRSVLGSRPQFSAAILPGASQLGGGSCHRQNHPGAQSMHQPAGDATGQSHAVHPAMGG